MNLSRVIWVLVAILVIVVAFLAGVVTTNRFVGRRATFAAYGGYGPGYMMRGGIAPTVPFTGTAPYGYGRGFGTIPGRGFGMIPGRGAQGGRGFGMMPGRGAQGGRGFRMMPGWRR